MNYQNFASFNEEISRPTRNGGMANIPMKNLYDQGSGIHVFSESTATMRDIYTTPFLFLQEHPNNYKYTTNVVANGLRYNSDLSKIFYSDENICRIQKMIRREIYTRSNGKYKMDVDQDLQDLYVVMKGVFTEHARFLPTMVVKQVKRLNQIVVQTVVPGMFSKINQQETYLKEINKPITPMDLPLNVGNKGRRTLPSVSYILGI